MGLDDEMGATNMTARERDVGLAMALGFFVGLATGILVMA